MATRTFTLEKPESRSLSNLVQMESAIQVNIYLHIMKLNIQVPRFALDTTDRNLQI